MAVTTRSGWTRMTATADTLAGNFDVQTIVIETGAGGAAGTLVLTVDGQTIFNGPTAANAVHTITYPIRAVRMANITATALPATAAVTWYY